MGALAVNCLEGELEPTADYCRAEGLGLEVTALAFPENLDTGFNARIDRHVSATQGVKPLSSHGPFFDLFVASRDPSIVEVCRTRHLTAIRASQDMGASIYVAHVNYNPLIKGGPYRGKFAERMREFWLPLADQAATTGMVIVLENLWEEGPDVQQDVLRQADHPNLKASFDNGHALVYSSQPSNEWVDMLESDLAHCHLHDNDGKHDQHHPVGLGIEDWEKLASSLERSAPQAVLVVESDSLERNKESVSAARSRLF